TQRQEGDVNLFLPRHGVSDGLGELGLTRADVSGQNDEWRAAQDSIKKGLSARVVTLRPGSEASGIDEQAEDFGQAALLVVQAHEARE
ncbi:hypothetical protein ABTA91_18975, partial [Acinetobacter baumannii]